MPWPAYQSFLAAGTRHIGLVPELATPFNRARSHTKFFDITRCRAVGIYAAGSACADVVRDGVDGLVVAMEPDAWVAAVQRLAAAPATREALLEGARQRVAERCRLAERQGGKVADLLRD
jgi:glycosyltransferase involved in cell wall biosynthesis